MIVVLVFVVSAKMVLVKRGDCGGDASDNIVMVVVIMIGLEVGWCADSGKGKMFLKMLCLLFQKDENCVGKERFVPLK